MGALKYERLSTVELRECSLDEKWLQDRISEDPTILNLGDLRVVARERRQSSGGRIDFLMQNNDTETMYEIEVMLGQVDESHIIRTIEYWDLERRRFPDHDHVAVIVAEDITSRFFNVISILNNSLPLIAIQLNAYRRDDSVLLGFTRVLDCTDIRSTEDPEQAQITNRGYWEQRASKDALAVGDQLIKLVVDLGMKSEPTYNAGHIALAALSRNFCWLHPRKQSAHCLVEVRVGPQQSKVASDKLESIGIDATIKKSGKNISFQVRKEDIGNNRKVLTEILNLGFKYCS